MDSSERVSIVQISTNNITIQSAVSAGVGKPSARSVLLIHGWPFDWTVWTDIIPGLLDAGYEVIAPDLRGVGGSSRPSAGYDPHTLADDLAGLLAALGVGLTSLVAFDVGAWPAVMLAMRRPGLVEKLVLSESLLGALPGAEEFLKDGPPWWYGFHAQSGLAERAITGNEEAYLNWFFETQTVQTLSEAKRRHFVQVYSGVDALRGGFGQYRAMKEGAAQYDQTFKTGRLRQPTLVVGAGMVKDYLKRQLQPLADQLFYSEISDCGHVVPLEQPHRFLELILDHLSTLPSSATLVERS